MVAKKNVQTNIKCSRFECPHCNGLSLFLFPCQMKPMVTTIGTLDPPLGNARLQASKLIAAILATNSDTINAELANLGTLQVLWVGIQIKITI